MNTKSTAVEVNPFEKLTDNELLNVWNHSDEGFAGESVFLASRVLISRGYRHIRNEHGYGMILPPSWTYDPHSHPELVGK